ncbi:hypothetical protein JG687_00014464 [Phytophthora cactorum]|uniref:Uncharacterized protein n=1 Tax=Phytophthora cactorum TaxID=29920 RepID=A0A329RN99_9STRA|nr:hypothetical protein Pcac1_g9374 [Phytophthora cactorum]KAG2823958.1 hypothetical protein PC113_g22103 [Phytophthora cactorum]KAG2967679.1 hypothetical protein PC118_g18442 [Phytophthora cactorum]KAG3053578.1 hypothetical protein PC122_g22291 [Phytophthora cactorum]KAG3127739.1 hypothetical protein C6341_g24856 [Phytophthora cactorum]
MDRLTTGVIQSNRRRQDSDTKAKMRRLLRRVRQLEEQTLVGHLCRKAADKAEREQRIADTKALGADLRGLKLQLKIMFDAYIPAESLEDLVPLPLAPRLVPTEQPSPRTPVSTPAFTANKQKPSQNPAPLMQSRSTVMTLAAPSNRKAPRDNADTPPK